MLHSPCLTLPSQRTTLGVQALCVFMSPCIHCWEIIAWACTCQQDWHLTFCWPQTAAMAPAAPGASHWDTCRSMGVSGDTSTQSCICSSAMLPCPHASADDSYSSPGCPEMAPAASGGRTPVCNAPPVRQALISLQRGCYLSSLGLSPSVGFAARTPLFGRFHSPFYLGGWKPGSR